MKYLKDPFVRNLYGLSLGLCLCFLNIGTQTYGIIASSLIVYLFAKVFDKKCDWITFFFLYSLLIAAHVYRFYTDYYGWKLDGTTTLMVLL